MPISTLPISSTAIAAVVEETRILRVQKVEPFLTSTGKETGAFLPSGSGNTTTIFSDSGPGTVESIQLALNGCVDDGTYFGTLLQITVDSVLVASVDVGLFFLTYGGVASKEFLQENIAITFINYPSTRTFAASRKILIPYTTNCTIVLKNAGSGNPDIFSQVEYRHGAAPAGRYGPRRIKFNAAYVPLTSTAAYATFNPLATVTGKAGLLEAIQVFAFCTSASSKALTDVWLKGNTTITADGSAATTGSTDDFYGFTSYGDRFADGQARTLPDRGLPTLAWVSPSVYYGAAYRFFGRTPIVFDASLAVSMANGQQYQGGSAPPTIQFASLVIYYTTA